MIRPTRRAFLLGLLVVLLLVLQTMIEPTGWRRWRQLSQEYDRLTARSETLRRQNDELREEIAGLRSEPARIERLSRSLLGMVREGETVVHVPGLIGERDRGEDDR